MLRVAGLILALLMMVAGGLWTFEGLGWIGESAAGRSTQAALGPVLAGFGVALAYVTIRSHR